MKVALNWKVASLTLLTWPVALWLAPNPDSRASKTLLVIASLPLLIAVTIELYTRWRQLKESPESYVEGSPAGNKIAIVLAVALIGLLVCLAYSVVRHDT